MATEKTSNRGGARQGSGRKATGRTVAVGIRLTPEAVDKLDRLTDNRSEYIDRLIMEQ